MAETRRYYGDSYTWTFDATALRYAKSGVPNEPDVVRRLDQRARRVLALFAKRAEITATRARSYGLSAKYRQYMKALGAARQ